MWATSDKPLKKLAGRKKISGVTRREHILSPGKGSCQQVHAGDDVTRGGDMLPAASVRTGSRAPHQREARAGMHTEERELPVPTVSMRGGQGLLSDLL